MKYLIFDTETGGLDPEKDALISVAVIVVNDKLEEITRFHSLVRNTNKKNIGEIALSVNNITVESLENGLDVPRLRGIWEHLSKDVGILIGHNVAFDIKFLRGNDFDIRETAMTLDTMHLSWDVWEFEKAKLEIAYARIGKEVLNAHDALYDCEMVLDLLRWYVDNGHIELPLPSYPIVNNYFEHKAFGYKKMVQKGLIKALDK